MKNLKFNSEFIPLILSGVKTTTWRLFDDKNLDVGDDLVFIDATTGKSFSQAKILSVSEKMPSEISSEDRIGHEPIGEGVELLKHFEVLYKKPIFPNELIKIIRFQIK